MCVVLQAACLSSRIAFSRNRLTGATHALLSTSYRRCRAEKVTGFFKISQKSANIAEKRRNAHFFLKILKKPLGTFVNWHIIYV